MLDPINTPEKAKKSIIAMLLKIGASDQEQSRQEIGYIHHVAQQLGLSASDVNEVSANQASYPFKVPSEERDRMMILYYFLFFMKADGKIQGGEVDQVKKLGFKLGFRPELVDAMIDIIRAHVDKVVPPDTLLQKVKTYLN